MYPSTRQLRQQVCSQTVGTHRLLAHGNHEITHYRGGNSTGGFSAGKIPCLKLVWNFPRIFSVQVRNILLHLHLYVQHLLLLLVHLYILLSQILIAGQVTAVVALAAVATVKLQMMHNGNPRAHVSKSQRKGQKSPALLQK